MKVKIILEDVDEGKSIRMAMDVENGSELDVGAVTTLSAAAALKTLFYSGLLDQMCSDVVVALASGRDLEEYFIERYMDKVSEDE